MKQPSFKNTFVRLKYYSTDKHKNQEKSNFGQKIFDKNIDTMKDLCYFKQNENASELAKKGSTKKWAIR